ncbi:MAG: hypothetical protein ACYDDF_07680 [Thermoplasmatota archaeon]
MKAKSLVGAGGITVLAIMVATGTAMAAIVLTYSNTSTLTTGVKQAPIQFAAGSDSGTSDYVPAFSLSTNMTTFSATIHGVPEATVTIGDLVELKNVDSRAHDVTLSTSQITNSYVTAEKIDFYNGATLVGTLDLKSASPSVTFSGLAAGSDLTGKVTITLASGAGANNVGDSRAVTATVSS